MGFFDKLFGKKKEKDDAGGTIGLTTEQFFATEDVRGVLDRYRRPAILLRPHPAPESLGHWESKFGGTPNFEGFDSYPGCDACGTPLNFVLQLYREDFPSFYFPGEANLFQLFRCPNEECQNIDHEHYDQKMFHYYFSVSGSGKDLEKPFVTLAKGEAEVPDCSLKPEKTADYPNYDEYEDDEFGKLEKKYGEELAEAFIDTYSAVTGTKLGGYPSFTQGAWYPECSCGKTKEFFFQLSSEDPVDVEGENEKLWSPHGIMIGDVGNIYYYVCRSCGPETIESYWDCC